MHPIQGYQGQIQNIRGMIFYLAVLGVAAFENDRGAMLKPPPQQCLCNCLAILLCNVGYFCILHQYLAVILPAYASRALQCMFCA